MNAKEFKAALRKLGLTTASQRTAKLLGVNIRHCQRLAHGDATVPESIEKLLQMYLEHGTGETTKTVKCDGEDIDAVQITADEWDVFFPWGKERIYSSARSLEKTVRERFEKKERGMKMNLKAKRFYVYILRDPRPGKDMQPIYVGKGCGRRAHDHWRAASAHNNRLLRHVLGKIIKAELKPIVEIVRRFEVDTDAYQFETEVIAKYGRRDMKTGSLCNLTDGGEGGSGSLAVAERGRIWLTTLHADPQFAADHAERMRERWANDAEFKNAQIQLLQKRNADPEFNKARLTGLKKKMADPEYAKVHAAQASERMRKRMADPEFLAKIAAGRAKARANPAWISACAERMRKQWADPKLRTRMIAARRPREVDV